MRLGKLRISNFKGIKEKEIDFEYKDAVIKGKNGVGKTTIVDAYLWLLFNKDSFGKTDFGIKTLDSNGNEIHHLDHAVYAEFLINDELTTLEKVYKEQWTKQNGASQSQLKGHTIKYKVNGVPHKKGDYENVIKSIIGEETFRTITSTTYYNDNLKWQDRRKDLMDKFGNMSDEEVIKSNEELLELPEMLGNHNVSDFEKILKERRTELKKEIEHIPTRIDELHKSKVDVQGAATARNEIERIDNEVKELEKQVSAIENGSAISNKEIELKDIENQLNARKNELEKELIEQGTKISEELNLYKSDLANINNDIAKKRNDIQHQHSLINDYKSKQQGLREQYIKMKEQAFESKVSTHCPTCEQSLPADEVEKVKKKELEEYNLKFAEKREEINRLGVGYKKDIEVSEATIQALENEIKKLEVNAVEVEKKVSKLEESLVAKREELKSTRNDVKTNELNALKESVEQSIMELKESSESALNDLNSSIKTLRDEKATHEQVIAAAVGNERIDERIKELDEKLNDLQKQLENTELGLYLIGLFVKTKVDLLTDKINSHFEITKWKLFDVQVNGGINETCVATYNGVPYDAGLNAGARVMVGLDIANTMAKHYGVNAPIFVDNAESVSEKLVSNSQLVKLVVDPQEEIMKVEVDK